MKPYHPEIMINTNNLLELKSFIMLCPDSFDMEKTWLEYRSEIFTHETGLVRSGGISCGCLAGHAVHMFYHMPGGARPTHYEHVEYHARTLFNLTIEQSNRLFTLSKWPPDKIRDYYAAKTGEKRVKIAAHVLSEFIEVETENQVLGE